jgi:hypothetical protein
LSVVEIPVKPLPVNGMVFTESRSVEQAAKKLQIGGRARNARIPKPY